MCTRLGGLTAQPSYKTPPGSSPAQPLYPNHAALAAALTPAPASAPGLRNGSGGDGRQPPRGLSCTCLSLEHEVRMQNPPGTRSARRAQLCTAVTVLLGPRSPPKRGRIFLTHFCCPGSCRESGWRCVGAEPHDSSHGIWGLYGSSQSECAKIVTLGRPGCSELSGRGRRLDRASPAPLVFLSYLSAWPAQPREGQRLLEARETPKRSDSIHPNLPNGLNRIIRGTSLPPAPLPSPGMAERDPSTPAATVQGLLQHGERGWGSLTSPRGRGSGCPVAGHAAGGAAFEAGSLCRSWPEGRRPRFSSP